MALNALYNGVAMNLSALFLSLKRLSEVVDQGALSLAAGAQGIALVPNDGLRRVALVSALEEAALKWITSSTLPKLGELIATDKLNAGIFFTHYGPLYGKGIIRSAEKLAQGLKTNDSPMLRAKLDSCHHRAVFEIQAHPDNYTSSSAPGALSGQKRLFVVARLADPELPTLRAQAYVIGHLHQEPRQPVLTLDRFNRIQWQMEVFLPHIEVLAPAADASAPTNQELQTPGTIPEVDVKNAFAEIIDEPFVPKDWGGEQSDLFSTRLSLQGEQVATAFAFKGPAKLKPLTMADLGKNGDQISRPFAEPADLVVLQHCHRITTAVRDHMRAFATRIYQLRPFFMIDGADTIRILRTYRKLGFS